MSRYLLSLCVAVSIVLGMSQSWFVRVGAEGASDTKSDTILKGQIVKVDVTLNTLRDARLSVSRVRKATANLYDEVTRQQMTMTYNPNMVGSTVITVPMPQFTGQYLPARKKWVKASMAEISPIMELLKEDVDTAIENDRHTEVSEKLHSDIESLRDEVFSMVKDSFKLYKELETLADASSLDNNSIATAAKSLDADMKQLDKFLKRGVAMLQKEAKQKRKAA